MAKAAPIKPGDIVTLHGLRALVLKVYGNNVLSIRIVRKDNEPDRRYVGPLTAPGRICRKERRVPTNA